MINQSTNQPANQPASQLTNQPAGSHVRTCGRGEALDSDLRVHIGVHGHVARAGVLLPLLIQLAGAEVDVQAAQPAAERVQGLGDQGL